MAGRISLCPICGSVRMRVDKVECGEGKRYYASIEMFFGSERMFVHSAPVFECFMAFRSLKEHGDEIFFVCFF